MEVLFLVFYAVMLAAVSPYITKKTEYVGTLVPGAIALIYGLLLWVILTWLGLPSSDGWIWILTMFTMPVAMIIGEAQLHNRRAKNPELNEKL